jgi:hypothetical protein
MTAVKRRPSGAQHLEAAAHGARPALVGLMSHTAPIVAQQAHVPHGQKLHAVEHQAHPVQHHALAQLSEPQQ